MQGIIVGIIVLICVGMTIKHIIQFIKKINRNKCACGHCDNCPMQNKNKIRDKKNAITFGN